MFSYAPIRIQSKLIVRKHRIAVRAHPLLLKLGLLCVADAAITMKFRHVFPLRPAPKVLVIGFRVCVVSLFCLFSAFDAAALCLPTPRRQINVGKLDPVTGKFTGESDVYALAGYLRGRVRNTY